LNGQANSIEKKKEKLKNVNTENKNHSVDYCSLGGNLKKHFLYKTKNQKKIEKTFLKITVKKKLEREQ